MRKDKRNREQETDEEDYENIEAISSYLKQNLEPDEREIVMGQNNLGSERIKDNEIGNQNQPLDNDLLGENRLNNNQLGVENNRDEIPGAEQLDSGVLGDDRALGDDDTIFRDDNIEESLDPSLVEDGISPGEMIRREEGVVGSAEDEKDDEEEVDPLS